MEKRAKMLGPRVDFDFAFNDTVFSDRVLRIELVADSSDSDFDGLNCATSSKRRRVENSEGDEVAHSNDSDCSTVVDKVKTLLISSPILAASSPFFYKLFKNGMRESHHNHVTLRINASEETALMDLLKFIYNYTLSASTAPDLLNVLMAADKFEVISCMTYCTELLQKLPMSLESALLYLELPSSVLMAEAVQPLKDAAKQYLFELYKDFNESCEEMMALPLSALKVVLGSDVMEVPNEDFLFDFILKWACARYPKLEERQEILTKGLVQFIRFPYMSYSKLRRVRDYPDLDVKDVSKLVDEALFFKGETPYGKQVATIKRKYRFWPVTVVQFECSRPQCVVYFDLKKEECGTLQSRKLFSDIFDLGGHSCFLLAQCNKDQLSSSHHFGLSVVMANSGNCMIDCEFAVMKKPLEEFESKYKVRSCTATKIMVGLKDTEFGIFVSKKNLFGIPWTEFMSNSSEYFINGILHLRVQLTLKR